MNYLCLGDCLIDPPFNICNNNQLRKLAMSDLDIIAQIDEKIHQLPPHLVTEAHHLISVLLQSYQETLEFSQTSLIDEPFIGMWQDCEEKRDSVAWVKNLRKSEWNSRNSEVQR